MWSARRSWIVAIPPSHDPRSSDATTVLRRTLLLALLLALAVPAVASAATITSQADGTLVYTAAGSARNHVGVQGSDDDATITF